MSFKQLAKARVGYTEVYFPHGLLAETPKSDAITRYSLKITLHNRP